MEEEVEKKKHDESILGMLSGALDACFGGAPKVGEVPFQYPWVIVAYMGCHFWCLCCAYILLLYGIEFEESVGHAWLASSMTSLAFDVFINEPAFLLATAIITSIWTVYEKQKQIRDMGMGE